MLLYTPLPAAHTAAGAAAAVPHLDLCCCCCYYKLLQVSALEELLSFLGGVAPFRSLSRELLTSLAVYVRPLRVGQGELLAVAGDKATALMIVQVGWMGLSAGCCCSCASLTTAPGV
jgi:hypothetical protein